MRRTMLQPANTLIVTLHCAIRTASSPAGAARSTDIGTLILAFREGGEEVKGKSAVSDQKKTAVSRAARVQIPVSDARLNAECLF